MYTIVGLGNPGEEYAYTRHNIGWLVLEHFCVSAGLPGFIDSSKNSGMVSEGVLWGRDVRVLLPTTYMNHSGKAVEKLVKTKEDIEKCIVVYDDVDLPFGTVRVAFGRGSGGHNGVQSVINSLGTKDFVRVRVGVAKKPLFFGTAKRPAGEKLTKHVLGSFTKREKALLPEISTSVARAIELVVTKGKERAMEEMNRE